jgi:hypothetical protein
MSGRQMRSLVYGGVFLATAYSPWIAALGVFFALMDFVEN